MVESLSAEEIVEYPNGGKSYFYVIDRTVIIVDEGIYKCDAKDEVFTYTLITDKQNYYMHRYEKVYRFLAEDKDTIETVVQGAKSHADMDFTIRVANREENVDASPLEFLFERNFSNVYGMNALKYLWKEYGVVDAQGHNYFLDYYVRTEDGGIAVEENGVSYHHPQIIGFGIFFAATLIALCIYEIKTPTPLINIRVFTRFRVNAVIISFFIIQIVYCGLLYLLPFYLTNTMRVDSLTSGFYLLIPPLVTAIVSVPISRWSDKTGRRWFMTASCVFLVLISVVFAFIKPEWGVIPLLASLLMMGLSIGFVSGPGSGRIVEVMPDGEQELGSTLMMTCVYCGGVVGTALYAAVFTLLTAEGGQILSFADLPTELFLSGFHLTMAAGIVISVISVLLSAVVPDRKSA